MDRRCVRRAWLLLILAFALLLADVWFENRRPELRPGDAQRIEEGLGR